MDAFALMDITVDFDKLFIRILNDLNPSFIELSHAIQARDTDIDFDKLFEKFLNYEAQLHAASHGSSSSLTTSRRTLLRRLAYLTHDITTTITIVATSATIGMATNHHLLEHLVFLSPSDHGRRLLPPKVGPVALCGATGHSTRQCSHLSQFALTYLPSSSPYGPRPVYSVPYAHTIMSHPS